MTWKNWEESYKKPLLNLDPKRAELYETCQRLGVGITVMKAFGGGDLLSEYSPAGKALTAVQCLHYALTRPAVAAVMSGARTMEELKASLDYEKASEAEKDYAEVFASFPKIKKQAKQKKTMQKFLQASTKSAGKGIACTAAIARRAPKALTWQT